MSTESTWTLHIEDEQIPLTHVDATYLLKVLDIGHRTTGLSVSFDVPGRASEVRLWADHRIPWHITQDDA